MFSFKYEEIYTRDADIVINLNSKIEHRKRKRRIRQVQRQEALSIDQDITIFDQEPEPTFEWIDELLICVK